jgi:protein arginine N-methyltransferase 1
VLAAHAGARKVFAIERGGIANLASRVFADNGVSDRIELLRVDARDATFSEPPTVIVTETLGSFGIDEDVAALLKLLAPRCAPSVRVIPSALRLMLAPLCDPALTEGFTQLDELEGVSLASVRRRFAQRANVRRVPASSLAGTPACVTELALSRDGLPDRYRARLIAARACEVNAIAGWFEAELAPGIVLSNAPDAPKVSWMQLTLPIDPPLAVQAGAAIEVEVVPRVAGGRSVHRWSATLETEPSARRVGDELHSSGGSLEDFALQLGLEIASGERLIGSPRLAAWNAISAGSLEPPFPAIDALAARLLAALPERYADLGDAREEVVALLDAAGALK